MLSACKPHPTSLRSATFPKGEGFWESIARDGIAFPFGEGGWPQARRMRFTWHVELPERKRPFPAPYYTVSTMIFPLVYTQMSLAIFSAFPAISAAGRSVFSMRARAAARA